MMRGQALLPIVGHLNAAFSKGEIHDLLGLKESFAPGKPLGPALANVIRESDSQGGKAIEVFIGRVPGGLQEAMRSLIYYALSTTPPTLITFAWSASYDYGLETWHVVEPAPEFSGITILLKSRYPDDKHPQDLEGTG